MGEEIKLLIADDSPIFVDTLRMVLERDERIEIVGVASTGIQAVDMAQRIGPDVIIMDIHMPEMDGLQAIERVMSTRATPILVLTADPQSSDSRWCFEALSRGALEISQKPDIDMSESKKAREFCEHLHLLASIPVVHHPLRKKPTPTLEPPMPVLTSKQLPGVVAIVASTGGPGTLVQILGALPLDFPLGVVVVQHLAPGFVTHFASWLQDTCVLEVLSARHNTSLQAGQIVIAPDDHHLSVESGGRLKLSKANRFPEPHCPSGNVLLNSVARAFGPHAVGLILTGMGKDGVDGLLKMRRVGGVTVTQDAETSIVDGMPSAARTSGAAEYVVRLEEVAVFLLHRARTMTKRR